MLKMRYLIFVCLVIMLAATPVLAQQTCPLLVQEALQALGNNCAGLERNSACYGYNRVQASFSEPMDEGFFSQVADRALLTMMQTLRTFPLDTSLNEWGIAVMNVQANVPNSLPGQAVTFLLVGDAEVENDVDAEDAFLPADPLEVTTSGIANLRGTSDFNAPIVVTLPVGTILPADGRSDDGLFLRVVYEGQVLWVNADAVNGNAAVNALPTLNDSERTPMQAFYFSSGVGETACNEAPSLVAVSSPNNLSVNLSVNGAEISVGSLITFRNTGDGAVMTVIEGSVENEDGLVIPAGQASDLELDEDKAITDWGEPRAITSEEFIAGQTVQQAMFRLQNTAPSTADEGVCNPGETITHTVASGENLFRIALRYGSTVSDIASLNNIADVTTIYVGQVLQIPCGSNASGESPLAGVPQPPSFPPISITLVPGVPSCIGFRQTSPLGSYPNGLTQFYWDGVVTATNYRVNIVNETGSLAATFLTGGSETNVTGDMSPGTVGQGTFFTWSVDALVNGQIICSTAGLRLPRDQFPQQGGITPTGVAPVSLFLTCPTGLVVLNWANVNPGSLISWNLTTPGPLSGSTTSVGTSGTQVLTTGSPTFTYSGTASSSNPPFSTGVSVTCP
jgi:hypothetical protein